MQHQRPLHHLAAQWALALPRGLQACLAAGPAAFPAGKPWDPPARAFGEQCLRGGWGVQHLVQAMAAAYESPLASMRQLAAGPSPEEQLQHLLTVEAAFAAPSPPAAQRSAAGTPGVPAQQQDQQHMVTPVMHWGAESGSDGAQQQQQQQPQSAGQAGAPPALCLQLTAGAAARLHEGADPGSGPLCVQVIGTVAAVS